MVSAIPPLYEDGFSVLKSVTQKRTLSGRDWRLNEEHGVTQPSLLPGKVAKIMSLCMFDRIVLRISSGGACPCQLPQNHLFGVECEIEFTVNSFLIGGADATTADMQENRHHLTVGLGDCDCGLFGSHCKWVDVYYGGKKF